MSFGTITTASGNYVERLPGTYVKDSVTFGSPENELRIRPNSNKKTPSLAVSRYKQSDYDNGTTTIRVNATASLQISLPAEGFSLSDIDSMVADIAEFISSANLSRMLQGEK